MTLEQRAKFDALVVNEPSNALEKIKRRKRNRWWRKYYDRIYIKVLRIKRYLKINHGNTRKKF